MNEISRTQLMLEPELGSIAGARQAVREALSETPDADLREAAVLAVSELATDAVLHTNAEVRIRIVVNGSAVRVEIEDHNHVPARRPCSQTAVTGRGLIVEEYVDRWGATKTDHGRILWFEIGHPPTRPSRQEPRSGARLQGSGHQRCGGRRSRL